MPPKQPEKLEKAQKEAVIEAERIAKEKEKYYYSENEILDHHDELKYFYKTAHKTLTKYVEQIDDPRLKEYLEHLNKILKQAESDENKYIGRGEKRAHDYWQELTTIFELEERKNLKHGESLLKDLGIDGEVSLVEYYQSDYSKNHIYKVKKDRISYEITFDVDTGEIDIEMDTGEYKSMMFFGKNISRYDDLPRQAKKISLKDLKNLSAFEYKFDFGRLFYLGLAADRMKGMISAPKRSTDPNTQKLIKLEKEIEEYQKYLDEMDEAGKRELTGKEQKIIIEKLSELFAKRVQLYFEIEVKDDENDNKLALIYQFVSEYPELAEKAVFAINDPKNLEIFDLETYPKLADLATERRKEITSKDINKFTKFKEYKALKDFQKSVFKDLLSHGDLKEEFRTDKGYKKYLAALKNLPKELEWYYIRTVKKGVYKLVQFTKHTRGLNKQQYYEYSTYCRENFLGFKQTNRVVRQLKERESLKNAQLILQISTDPKKTKKLNERIKKNKERTESHNFRLEGVMEKVSLGNTKERLLNYMEKLDDKYLENLGTQVIPIVSVMRFKPDQKTFSQLNSLTVAQRTIFSLIVKDYIHTMEIENKEEFGKLIQTLKKIRCVEQIRHIKEEVARSRIDWDKVDEKDFFARVHARMADRKRDIEDIHKAQGKASKHTKIWEAIEEEKQKDEKFDLYGYKFRALETLINKGIPEDKIIKSLKYLNDIKNEEQTRVIEVMANSDNINHLLEIIANEEGNLRKITYGSRWYIMEKYIGESKHLLTLPGFIKRIGQISENKDSISRISLKTTRRITVMSVMVSKTKNCIDLIDVIESLESKAITDPINNILKKKHQNLSERCVEDLITKYFCLNVSPEEIKDAEKIIAGLKEFINKADEAKYNPSTDPDLSNALSLLDPKKTLEKKDADFTHIAFILNILMDSSEEYSKDKIRNKALSLLNDQEEVLREKGAKLLVGMGGKVSEFDLATIQKIAKEGVDKKLTKLEISGLVTQSHLDYLKQEGEQIIPLSLYYSMLITLKQKGKENDPKAFEQLVDRFHEIADKNVYEGKVMILSHNEEDRHHSFLSPEDTFSTDSHEIMARDVQGLRVDVLRHEKEGENVESMFSLAEVTEGNLTMVIGGHGANNFISFGREHFYMRDIFERLAKRVAKQKKGPKWKTTVIFHSCHSGYNITELMNMWNKDPRTKDHPVKMLSSSSEDEGSAKMASDSWVIKSKKVQESGEPLTWREYYNDIESRNFIMSGRSMNSNETLFINGEPIG